MSAQPIYGIPAGVEHWAIALSAVAAAYSLGGFPIWWAFINGQAVVTSAVAVGLLVKLIPRGRRFLLVVALPPITFGIHAAGALTGYAAVSTTTDRATTWAGIGGSMVVSVVLLWIALFACRRGEPAALDAGELFAGYMGSRTETPIPV